MHDILSKKVVNVNGIKWYKAWGMGVLIGSHNFKWGRLIEKASFDQRWKEMWE